MMVKVGEKEVEGQIVPFSTIGEPWAEYLLEDGNIVRARIIAKRFIKCEGVANDQGEPMYVMQSDNVTVVNPAS